MRATTLAGLVPLVSLLSLGSACTRADENDRAGTPAAREGAPAAPTQALRRTTGGGLALGSGAIASLDVYVDGGVVHALVGATLAGADDRWGLYYLPLSPAGEALAAPVRVDVGPAPPHRPSLGGDPQIAARGANLIAVWTGKGIGHKERGPLQTALSRDRGKTWEPGGMPAPVANRGGQAFIDAVADGHGFHIVWLDDRGDPKGLYHGTSSDGGLTWRIASIVDGETCQCCWNRLVRGRGGQLYALYRDSAPRDMMVSRWDGRETWESLGRAGRFDWGFQGCPHVGGAIAVSGGADDTTLHTTVWTGMEGTTGLFYVRYTDSGWGDPHLLAADGRHSDVAVSADGRHVVAVWDMTDPSDQVRAVFTSQSTDGGETWSAPRRISGPHRAGYPRALLVEDRFRVVWVEDLDDDRGLHAMTLER